MSRITKWMDSHFYPQHGDYWDDVLFRRKLLDQITEDSVILDFGAGVGGLRNLFDFRSNAARVAGVDVDPAVVENPYLNEAGLITEKGRIPFPDNTFDVVFSVNVLEHVQDPELCFREIHRVLRPEGIFMVKTPNFWHYVPLIASMTPNSFHVFINKVRGRSAEHTFPTVYKCNTPGAVRRLSKQTGFLVKEIALVEGRPEYLRFMAPLYLLGCLYERCVNNVPGFSRFRGVLYFTLVRQ